MRAGVDLWLRVAAGVPAPSRLFDAATYPKSEGDVQCIAALALGRDDVREQLRLGRRR